MIRSPRARPPNREVFPVAPPYAVGVSGVAVAIGLFGMVLLAGLAVVFASLLAISLRRAARRKATYGHPPTQMSDAWVESGRRGGEEGPRP